MELYEIAVLAVVVIVAVVVGTVFIVGFLVRAQENIFSTRAAAEATRAKDSEYYREHKP